MKSLKKKAMLIGLMFFGLDQASAQDYQEEFPTDPSGPSLTYDLGASTGSYNGKSYTEVNLGVNYYFNSYLAWRNAGFYRTVSEAENIYGLDTSLRGEMNAALGEASAFRTFAGGGYRFVSKGDHLPFVEGGIQVSLGGLTVGGGAKMLLHQLIRSTDENETQYFLILSGSGRL